MADEIITLKLTPMDAKALRAAMQWSEMLAERGQLEIYDWQQQSFESIREQMKYAEAGIEATTND
jgi:hypothetical protein